MKNGYHVIVFMKRQMSAKCQGDYKQDRKDMTCMANNAQEALDKAVKHWDINLDNTEKIIVMTTEAYGRTIPTYD